MDAQPDVGKLAEAFTTSSTALAAASREIALVVNLPTFNHGQRIFEAIERLTTSIDDLRTDVITMRTDIRTLRTDMNSKFENLELRMSAESADFFLNFQSFIMNDILQCFQSHGQSVQLPHLQSRDTASCPERSAQYGGGRIPKRFGQLDAAFRSDKSLSYRKKP